MRNLSLIPKNNSIVNCAAVKKKNIEISNAYYSSMESYVASKQSAYNEFSKAMNMITPTTYDNGETSVTKTLEEAVYAAKKKYDNIPIPLQQNKYNINCCTSDDMLYYQDEQSCIIPTMLGTYKMSDNVHSNKLSFTNSSVPDINSCILACSVNDKCSQALYNKNTKICYLMGKDDPGKTYTYTYSRDYALLSSPSVNSSPTNISLSPSISTSPETSTYNETLEEAPLNETLSSSSIVIIVTVLITVIFILFMLYLYFSRKTS